MGRGSNWALVTTDHRGLLRDMGGSNWTLVTTDHRGLLTDMGGGVTGHWSLQTTGVSLETWEGE